jgi:hypothetical protein
MPAIAAANTLRTVRQERKRTLICRTTAKEAASHLSPALLFWETYMQASCQSDEISQHSDFKGFFKIHCNKESSFLANIQNPAQPFCGYPAKANADKKARTVAGPGFLLRRLRWISAGATPMV